MSFGVTSMSAPLRRVLVRRPATAGDWAGAGWRVPDPAALAGQHEAFCALLADLGVQVEVADALAGQVDAVYMHDPLLMTARGGIPLRMRKPARAREPAHARDELERLGVPVLGELPEGAYADGGDRFWIDDRPDGDRPRLPHQPRGRRRRGRARRARGRGGRDLRRPARPRPGARPAPAVVHLGDHRAAVRGLRAARARAAAPGPARARPPLDRDRRARATRRWAATSSPSARASS